MDDIDRRIVLATQAGLPLAARPYHAVAAQLALSPELVMARMEQMCERGLIRRIGAVPNHYALGYVANGMTVWDVVDAEVDALGEAVGRLPFVSHCYRRPRRPPAWPYNLFAMVHGRDRAAVETGRAAIAELLAAACRAGEVLYSSRILKKTGLRLTAAE